MSGLVFVFEAILTPPGVAGDRYQGEPQGEECVTGLACTKGDQAGTPGVKSSVSPAQTKPSKGLPTRRLLFRLLCRRRGNCFSMGLA